MSFTGEYRHTIDAKGRLIVPSRLRDELEDDNVVLTPWPDGCIALWSGEGWRQFEAMLLELRRADPDNRAVLRWFAARAHSDKVDRQGRITVPQHLRDEAAISKEVVVSGSFDHGEIWSPERWESQTQEPMTEPGRLNELFSRLPI